MSLILRTGSFLQGGERDELEEFLFVVRRSRCDVWGVRVKEERSLRCSRDARHASGGESSRDQIEGASEMKRRVDGREGERKNVVSLDSEVSRGHLRGAE